MEPETITLLPEDGGKPVINFMFNPPELTQKANNEPQDNPGANNLGSGQPKVSFGKKTSDMLEMKGVVFDTYEEGTNVIEKYITPFKEGMTFIEEMKRPPVYRVVWGKQQYMRRCFIKDLSYTLTKFLPDGTPVRAVVDISLKEAEDINVTNQAMAGVTNPTSGQRSGLAGYASLFTGLFSS
jgi:Contractile injection system tube protein